MNEVIAALITGIASVIAARLASGKPTDKDREDSVDKKGEFHGLMGFPIPKKGYSLIFAIGALMGIVIFHVAANSAQTGLSSGGYKVPTGTIVAFMGNVAPDGWLLCDGTKIETEYKELRRIVGEKTPDLQGRFLRGLDPTGTVDIDGKGRALGSPQEDAFKKHSHSVMRANGGDGGHPGQGDGLYKGLDGSTGEAGGSSVETRPKNVAVNFIIKY